jgi:hypothetical protein
MFSAIQECSPSHIFKQSCFFSLFASGSLFRDWTFHRYCILLKLCDKKNRDMELRRRVEKPGKSEKYA